MKSNRVVQAVVSAGIGAAFWVLASAQGFSVTSEDLYSEIDRAAWFTSEEVLPTPETIQAEQFERRPEINMAALQRASAQALVEEQRLKEERAAEAKKAAEARKERHEKQLREKKAKAAKAKAKKAKKAKAAAKAKARKAEKKRKAAKARRASLRGVPVPGQDIGATFGQTGSWSRYHTGLDFRASNGTTVRAVAPGRIIYAGNKGSWAGNYVVIRHAGGKKTLYAHLSSISKHGGKVSTGTRIGRVGSTGRSFGSHLHLELYPSGASPGDVYSAIDPKPWLRKHGVRLR